MQLEFNFAANTKYEPIQNFKIVCRMRDNSFGWMPIKTPVYEIMINGLPHWLRTRANTTFVVHKDLKGKWCVSHKESGAKFPGTEDTSRERAVDNFFKLTSDLTEKQFENGLKHLENKIKANGGILQGNNEI